MSIVNVYMTEGRGFVAVDTAGHSQHVGAHEFSKMFWIPHARLLVACRGEALIGFATFGALYMRPDIQGFDDFMARRGEILKDVAGAYWQAESAAARAGGSQEVYVLGPSEQQGQMAAVACHLDSGSREFRVSEIPKYSAAPEAGFDTAREDELMYPDGMRDLARRQVAAVRAKDPRAVIGGRLLFAQVSWNGAIFSDLGTI